MDYVAAPAQQMHKKMRCLLEDKVVPFGTLILWLSNVCVFKCAHVCVGTCVWARVYEKTEKGKKEKTKEGPSI